MEINRTSENLANLAPVIVTLKKVGIERDVDMSTRGTTKQKRSRYKRGWVTIVICSSNFYCQKTAKIASMHLRATGI